MVPWTHLREPRLGRLLTVLMTEFTHFNLVIRLSKGKQPALFRVSPVDRCVEQRAAVPGFNFFSIVAAASRETSLFSKFARETDCYHSNMTRSQDML